MFVFTLDLDPLELLIDDATIARWNNEKLPADRMSTENAAIVSNCKRWPLLVDPQLQVIVWQLLRSSATVLSANARKIHRSAKLVNQLKMVEKCK